MRNAIIYTILLTLAILPAANAIIIPQNATGANSRTYLQNYNDMVGGWLNNPNYNTTRTFTVGGVTYLTVPEYTSSTACGVVNLQGAYNATPNNMTKHEIRSDAFSEVGIVLAASNRSNEFDWWYNTAAAMDQCGYGVIPCWVVEWNQTKINAYGAANDTAIDGSVRVGIALYIAANNTNFNQANRTAYVALANQLAIDIYQYETISITSKATRSGLNVTRLPMGGGDCAAGGLGCSTDMWIGYGGDIIKFFQYAYIFTGNATYNLAARNFTAAFHSVSLQNDTDGDGFGVAPFNFNWDVTTYSVLGHAAGGDVNTYHYAIANEQWDDSDAPRFHNFCDILRVENLTDGTIDGVYGNVSTYCAAWMNALPKSINATQSTLQYRYNGTGATGITTGYYQNGLGASVSTFLNQSWQTYKVNETISHMGWSAYTYDSSSCGTPGSFRGSKGTKALMTAIGLDENWYAEASQGGGQPAEPEVQAASSIGASCDDVVGGLAKLATRMPSMLALLIALSLFGFIGYGVVSSGASPREIIVTLAVTVAVLAVALSMAYSTIGGLC